MRGRYIVAPFVCTLVCTRPADLPRAIKPGGWVELQELRFVFQSDDGPCPSDYACARFSDYCREGFRAFGVDPMTVERNAQLIADAGFTNVAERVWKVPIGPWPRDPKLKTAGVYNRAVLVASLQAVSMAPLTRGLKWTPAEVELFLVDVRQSLQNDAIHAYLTFHAAYGQKAV